MEVPERGFPGEDPPCLELGCAAWSSNSLPVATRRLNEHEGQNHKFGRAEMRREFGPSNCPASLALILFSLFETGLCYVVQNSLNLSIEWVGMAGMSHHDWLPGFAIPGDKETSVLKLVLKSY